MKAFLKHDRVLEFDCQPGDDVMQTLFQALAENTAVDGKPDDRVVSVPVKQGDRQQTTYFQLSHLVGLETLPVI